MYETIVHQFHTLSSPAWKEGERERGEKEGREYMREDEWMLVQNLLIPYYFDATPSLPCKSLCSQPSLIPVLLSLTHPPPPPLLVP